MSGKRYAEEFKIEAVKQVIDRGYKVNDVASRLGVTENRKSGTVYYLIAFSVMVD